MCPNFFPSIVFMPKLLLTSIPFKPSSVARLSKSAITCEWYKLKTAGLDGAPSFKPLRSWNVVEFPSTPLIVYSAKAFKCRNICVTCSGTPSFCNVA